MTSRVPFVLLLVATGLIFGCLGKRANIAEGEISPEEEKVGKHFIINNKALARRIAFGEVLIMRVGDLTKVQANVKNRKKKHLDFEYRFEWFDEQGMKIETPREHWEPMVIYGKDEAYLQGVSPEPRAVKFKIHIRKPQPVK